MKGLARALTPTRTLLLGLWLTTLFWPYAHSGGFSSALLLSLFPLCLAAAELLSSWEATVVAMLAAFMLELVVQVPEPFGIILAALAAIPHTLVSESPAAWATLPPTAGLVLILVAVVLGWLVFRLAQSRDRVLLLLLLGGIILIVNHTFWHLQGEGPVAAYLVVGLWLLADTHLDESAASTLGRPSGYWYGVLGLALVLPLVLGWSTAGHPGHVKGAGGSLPVGGGSGIGLANMPGGNYTTGIGIGDTSINHPVTPSHQTVLVVSGAPMASYWQTAVYNTFNGTTWSSPAGRPIPFLSGSAPHPFFSPAINGFSTDQWHVTVAMAGPSGAVPLVYSGTPTSISGVNGQVLPNREELIGQNPITYRVTMTVPVVNMSSINAVPFSPVPQSLAADLETPGNLSPRVGQLARRITAGARGPWQAAEDLAKYLDSHERYTFNFKPSSRGDAVNQFLLVTHAGYCDQFSTTFIMMARSIGIPARWVVGYGPGTYNIKTRDYVISAVDAHSWAQVYVAPYGWIPIDPTYGWTVPLTAKPGQPVTEYVTPHQPPVKVPTLARTHPKAPRVANPRPTRAPSPVAAIPWAALAAAGAAVAAVWLAWRNARFALNSPHRRLKRLDRRLWLLFRLTGRRSLGADATLRQLYLGLAPEYQPLLKPTILVMERWWYGGQLPDEPQLTQAEASVQEALHEALRGWWRRPLARLWAS